MDSKWLQLIAQSSVNELVNIRQIFFEASLSAANSGRFLASVHASFLRASEQTVRAAIDLRNIRRSIAMELTNNIEDGFSTLF